jgi:hypothetical protein
MITPVIVVLDEARDLGFEITGQVIVLEQNAVLERLVEIKSTWMRKEVITGPTNPVSLMITPSQPKWLPIIES